MHGDYPGRVEPKLLKASVYILNLVLKSFGDDFDLIFTTAANVQCVVLNLVY
jgi:hypothetical protein